MEKVKPDINPLSALATIFLLFGLFLFSLGIFFPCETREDRSGKTRVEKLEAPPQEELVPAAPQEHETRIMRVTAYCLCKKCCERWAKYKKTALGDNARRMDGVAAAFELLPPRTELLIPGVGRKEVDDTGRGMRDSAKAGITHIDVRMPTHRKAKRFGSRWLEVEIVTPDANP